MSGGSPRHVVRPDPTNSSKEVRSSSSSMVTTCDSRLKLKVRPEPWRQPKFSWYMSGQTIALVTTRPARLDPGRAGIHSVALNASTKNTMFDAVRCSAYDAT